MFVQLLSLQLAVIWYNRRLTRFNYEDIQRLVEYDLVKPPSTDHKARGLWKKQRTDVILRRKPFKFPTCFGLHQVLTNASALRGYAKWIIERYPIDAERGFSGNIVSRVKIIDGFVAPLYLLGGLLDEFADEWPKVVRKYGEILSSEPSSESVSDPETYITKVQLYQFFCWLIWGPSVPICNGTKCDRWGEVEHERLLQYGYGDENNSVLLQCDDLVLFAGLKSHMQNAPLAERMEAAGRVLYKDLIIKGKKHIEGEPYEEDDDFGEFRSWRKFKENINKLSPHIQGEFRQAGGSKVIIKIEPDPSLSSEGHDTVFHRSKYYGAYLWVLFAICDDTSTPEEKQRQRIHPAWRNILPYFVHGNIAEQHSYEHVSQLVAAAAVRGARQIFNAYEKNGMKIELHYICAIDHSNCGDKLLEETTEALILKRLLEIKGNYKTQLENLKLPAGAHDTKYKKPRLKIRIKEKEDEKEVMKPMDGCLLPSVVQDFFDSLEQRQTQNGGTSASSNASHSRSDGRTSRPHKGSSATVVMPAGAE